MAGNVSSYRSPGNAGGAWAQLSRFFRWWRRELSALVPAGLQPLPPPTRRFVWLEVASGKASLWRVDAARRVELASIDLTATDAAARKLSLDAAIGGYRNPPLGLSLPADKALRKDVSLPAAARENLRQVLAYELGRHTPFNADQAYFGYLEAADNKKPAQIELTLVTVPRQAVDEGLALLREWGRQARAVVVEDEIRGDSRYADLLPPEMRPRAGWLLRAGYAVMALLPVALLAAALATPLWQKREVAIALDARMAEARRQADAVDALRLELNKTTAEYHFLLEKKAKHPPAVALLEEVTRMLPDDTWLMQMEVRNNEVLLNGETGSSASLIRLLERSELLADPSFRSPLVKGRGNIERFQLAAVIREGGLAEALARQREASTPRKPGQKTPGRGG